MARHGGAGILPSGAYHLESPTTVTERNVEAWQVVLTESDTPQPAERPRQARSSSRAASTTSTTGTSATNESRCGHSPSPGRCG